MTDSDIRGTVTDAQGDPIQGATVSLFLADQASAVRETTTDSNGEYIFDLHPDGTGSSEDWHVAVSYTDANGTQNALSKPFVSASLPDFTFPVAASNLVAWYPFDPSEGARDQTGGVVGVGDPKDYSGTVNGATYQANGGVVDINSGSGSGAYIFDGNDDFINIGSILGGANSFSMGGWIRTTQSVSDSEPYQHPNLIGTVQQSGESQDFLLGLKNGTPIIFSESDGSGRSDLLGSTSINDDSYHHYFVTNDNGSVKIFVDGSQDASGTLIFDGLPSDRDMEIAKANWTKNRFYDGLIDDVRVYNRALTESEINQIYSNTAPKVNDATGGSTVTTETIDGQDYKIHAFENTGSSTFTVNDADSGASVDVLIVGGGGSGGVDNGGAGGTGGWDVASDEFISDSPVSNNGVPKVGNEESGEEPSPSNTGHGGHGANHNNQTSGAGGSGIVLIRYLL